MTYRFQEILRMIIPGLYLLSMLLCSFLYSGHSKLVNEDWIELQSVIKNFSSIILLFIPFLGFVAGYIVECIMSIAEHLFYFLGGRRPSKTILKGSFFYVIHNQQSIVQKLIGNVSLTNKESKKALQKAKQQIDRTKCSDFLYVSILARNIFGSQVLITLFLGIQFGWVSTSFLCALPLNILFFMYWYHKNHVYVKYIFAEYGNTCISGNSCETETT